MLKTKRSKLILFIIFLAILSLCFWFLKNGGAPTIDKNKILYSSIIDYSGEFNYRQTVNDCGPFSTAAVVRALTGKTIDSAEFTKNIGWRLPNKYTLPWGLEKQLKDNGISIETPNLKNLSEEDKILFLEEQLSQKNPVIILGQIKKYQHYITLFGFNDREKTFYVYDSFFDKGEDGLTKDANGDLPGNRNLSFEELLNFWRGGGMYGLYNWYAIVSEKR
jgi:hypothetical protein